MKLNKTSYASIAPVIQDALKKYASMEGKSVVTDIYLQPQMQTGELAVYNDDDELLASAAIEGWDDSVEQFLDDIEAVVQKYRKIKIEKRKGDTNAGI